MSILKKWLGVLLVILGVVVFMIGCVSFVQNRAGQDKDDKAQEIIDSWKKSPQPTISPSAVPSPSPISVTLGKPFAVVKIDKIKLKVQVLEGTSLPILSKGAGHYSHTELPGANGNFSIAAHVCCESNGEPFRYLHKLVPGDTVVVITASGTFTYKVIPTVPCRRHSSGANNHAIVTADRTDVLWDNPCVKRTSPTRKLMTMTTCYPYGNNETPYRLIVWAEQVDFRPATK